MSRSSSRASRALRVYRGGRVVRALVVLLAVALTPCLGGATQFSVIFETDADAGSGSEVVWEGFASLSHYMAMNYYDVLWTTLDLGATWNIGGFSTDGRQYLLVLESIPDGSAGNEVYLVTYASLADFGVHNYSWEGYTAHNINSLYTTRGLASDGIRYYMVLETDADDVAGSEVYAMTYTSLANLVAGNEETEAFSGINIASGWSIADLAADGDKFYLVLESDTDVATNEFYVITYASFANFLSNTQESAAYSGFWVSSGWSCPGFAAEIPIFEDGFESGNTSAWD